MLFQDLARSTAVINQLGTALYAHCYASFVALVFPVHGMAYEANVPAAVKTVQPADGVYAERCTDTQAWTVLLGTIRDEAQQVLCIATALCHSCCWS